MASKQAKVAQRDASQKLTKKNLYFQRLLLLRYLVAFFFFFNLYWLLAASLAGQWLRVVPLSLLLFSMGAISEFIRLYGHHAIIVPKQLFFTTWYLRLQMGTMAILFLLTFFWRDRSYFPLFHLAKYRVCSHSSLDKWCLCMEWYQKTEENFSQ